MATLCIASKANQATILPALLIVTLANETDPNAPIHIEYHEVDGFKSGNAAAVELDLGAVRAESPVYGSEKVVNKIHEAYPLLLDKNKDLVSFYSHWVVPSNLNGLAGQRMACSCSIILPYGLQGHRRSSSRTRLALDVTILHCGLYPHKCRSVCLGSNQG